MGDELLPKSSPDKNSKACHDKRDFFLFQTLSETFLWLWSVENISFYSSSVQSTAVEEPMHLNWYPPVKLLSFVYLYRVLWYWRGVMIQLHLQLYNVKFSLHRLVRKEKSLELITLKI